MTTTKETKHVAVESTVADEQVSHVSAIVAVLGVVTLLVGQPSTRSPPISDPGETPEAAADMDATAVASAAAPLLTGWLFLVVQRLFQSRRQYPLLTALSIEGNGAQTVEAHGAV
ncbi:hypothetical protein ACFQO4_05170 [Saliphagus sp. GCM10025334]